MLLQARGSKLLENTIELKQKPTIFDLKHSKCFFLLKEVIQPQVLLLLPCYDFTPVADTSLHACFLAVRSTYSANINSHGVTGGVYKARERIHRGMLIHDY